MGRLAPQPTKHSVAAFIRTHPALSWPLRILPGRRLVPAAEPSTGPAQGRRPSLNGGSYYLPGCSQGARPFPVSPDTPQWVLGPSTTKPRSSPWHQGHRDVAPPMCLGPSPHPVLPLCSSLTIQEASGPPDVPRTLCLGAFAFAVAAVSKALFAGSCTPQVRSLSARLCSNVPSVQTRGLPCPLPFTLTPLFFCTAMPICVPEAWRQPAGAWEVFTDYANSLLNISSAYVIPLRSIVLFSHLTGKPRHREAK